MGDRGICSAAKSNANMHPRGASGGVSRFPAGHMTDRSAGDDQIMQYYMRLGLDSRRYHQQLLTWSAGQALYRSKSIATTFHLHVRTALTTLLPLACPPSNSRSIPTSTLGRRFRHGKDLQAHPSIVSSYSTVRGESTYRAKRAPVACSSDDQPSTVLLAFYLRYPNPHATHVLSCDVISRKVDPVRGAITTQRLILKKGIVPRWARTWLENWGMMGGGGLEAWVLEESEVSLRQTSGSSVKVSTAGVFRQVTIDAATNQPVLKSMTRNISHKKIIHVAEGTEFHPAGTARYLSLPPPLEITVSAALILFLRSR